MSRERRTSVSLENLNEHARRVIFAPVAATRFNVCDQAIRSGINAIAIEKPRIAAEVRIAHQMPMTESVAAEPAAAAAVAVSAAAEVQAPEITTVDPSDNMAVGELAHAAHNPNASEDSSIAERVLAAFRRDGPQHKKAIDPTELQRISTAEAPTNAQEHQYVTGLQTAIQEPSHLPAFYDNFAQSPEITVANAQADVVRAFPKSAGSTEYAQMQPTYPTDVPEAA